MNAMAMAVAVAVSGTMVAQTVFEWVPAVRGLIWLAVLVGLVMLAAQRRPRWCWYPWLAAAVMAAGCSWSIGNMQWSRSAMTIAVVCVIGWARTRRD